MAKKSKRPKKSNALDKYKTKQKLGLVKRPKNTKLKVVRKPIYKKPIKCFAILSHGADHSIQGNNQLTTIPDSMTVVRYTKPGKVLYPFSLPFIVNKSVELSCKTGDMKKMKAIEYYMPVVKLDKRRNKIIYDPKIYKTTHNPFIKSQGERIINIPLEFSSHPTWELGLYELDFKTQKLKHVSNWDGRVNTNLGEVLQTLSEQYPLNNIIVHQLSCREGEIPLAEVKNREMLDEYTDDTLAQLFTNISVSEDPSFYSIEQKYVNGEVKVIGVFKDKKKARQVLNNLKEYTPPWTFFRN